MKTVTIRHLRQCWPETERKLQVENELIVTRDGIPVAKLVRFVPEKAKRNRWNPEAHMWWLKKLWQNQTMPSSDQALARMRADGGKD